MTTNQLIRDFIISDLLQGEDDNHLSEKDDLIESGIIDSLGIMNLLVFLEEKFSVTISNDDLIPENFSSISTITSLIDRTVNN